eukprot:gene33217-40986_t
MDLEAHVKVCPHSFIECPLFKHRLCSRSCTGVINKRDKDEHISASPQATLELISCLEATYRTVEILKIRTKRQAILIKEQAKIIKASSVSLTSMPSVSNPTHITSDTKTPPHAGLGGEIALDVEAVADLFAAVRCSTSTLVVNSTNGPVVEPTARLQDNASQEERPSNQHLQGLHAFHLFDRVKFLEVSTNTLKTGIICEISCASEVNTCTIECDGSVHRDISMSVLRSADPFLVGTRVECESRRREDNKCTVGVVVDFDGDSYVVLFDDGYAELGVSGASLRVYTASASGAVSVKSEEPVRNLETTSSSFHVPTGSDGSRGSETTSLQTHPGRPHLYARVTFRDGPVDSVRTGVVCEIATGVGGDETCVVRCEGGWMCRGVPLSELELVEPFPVGGRVESVSRMKARECALGTVLEVIGSDCYAVRFDDNFVEPYVSGLDLRDVKSNESKPSIASASSVAEKQQNNIRSEVSILTASPSAHEFRTPGEVPSRPLGAVTSSPSRGVSFAVNDTVEVRASSGDRVTAKVIKAYPNGRYDVELVDSKHVLNQVVAGRLKLVY